MWRASREAQQSHCKADFRSESAPHPTSQTAQRRKGLPPQAGAPWPPGSASWGPGGVQRSFHDTAKTKGPSDWASIAP